MHITKLLRTLQDIHKITMQVILKISVDLDFHR